MCSLQSVQSSVRQVWFSPGCPLYPPCEEEEDGERSQQCEAGVARQGGSTSRDGALDWAGPEGGEVPGRDVRRPPGRVLRRHPGPVLAGRGQGGDELLPCPVIAAFSAGNHFETPEHHQISNISRTGLLDCPSAFLLHTLYNVHSRTTN